MILLASVFVTTTKQAIKMKTGNVMSQKTLVACLLSVTLVACGESDLVELHERQFDDAIAGSGSESEAPPLAPGNPDEGLPPPVADLDLTQYELAFIDDFRGDTIDAAKWDTALWAPDTVIYDQLQFYVDAQSEGGPLPSPFSFNGEQLTISAVSATSEQRADANEQAYLSGLLTTRNIFEFTYGYIEARVKMQPGQGTWPSLWMLGSDTNGINPEVYIFEYNGAKPDSVFHNYNYLDPDGNLRSPGQQEVRIDGLSDDHRVLGLRWSPGELLYYVDGQPSYRIVGDNVPTESMYLVLNLAMGGVWPGSPDSTTPDPAILEVDYVRVYELLDQ